MDFLLQLKAYLENLGTFTNKVDMGLLNSDNGIALRPIPSKVPQKYHDNTNDYEMGFQIITRHEDQLISYTTMQEITDDLFDLMPESIVSGNDSFTFQNISISSTVNFIEKDPAGYMYSAIFTADIHTY